MHELKIEIRSKCEPDFGWHNAVMTFFAHMNPQQFCFEQCDFRINGIVYTDRSDEFIKVLEQHVLWTTLSD